MESVAKLGTRKPSLVALIPSGVEISVSDNERTCMSDHIQRILRNPTLHPNALTESERGQHGFKWHRYASSPRSSQTLCISAFGTLRSLKVRDKVVDKFLSETFPDYRADRRTPRWNMYLEYERPEILNETGHGQPTSVDVLLVSSKAVFAVVAKFVSDAKKGFGGCSQFNPLKCAGFYGPGSDRKTRSQAWCRLETWDGNRSTRAYWTLGKEYFRPEVFRMQDIEDACPMRSSNFQLMRNFLFAAAYARKNKISLHGVITIAPAATSTLLKDQVAEFRSTDPASRT